MITEMVLGADRLYSNFHRLVARGCGWAVEQQAGKEGSKHMSSKWLVAKGFETLEDRRLMSVGDLDPTFGSGGKYVPAAVPGPGELAPSDFVVQADGKILYAGYGLFDVGSLVRLNANGTL